MTRPINRRRSGVAQGPPGPPGPRGPRGPKGVSGPRGGGSHAELVGGGAAMEVVERLSEEMLLVHEDMVSVHRALETQLTRIAQIQQQLDELRTRITFSTTARPQVPPMEKTT